MEKCIFLKVWDVVVVIWKYLYCSDNHYKMVKINTHHLVCYKKYCEIMKYFIYYIYIDVFVQFLQHSYLNVKYSITNES